MENKAVWKKSQNPGALLAGLKRRYPAADCALLHKNPFQLLVATILSAQCTDERVNEVTPVLFKRLGSPRDFAGVSQAALQKQIRSTGFFRNKARSLRGMAAMVMEKFGGQVPKSMDELLRLPGVARKTANVVLGSGFGIAEGIAVDTHVMRLSGRLGLTEEKTPEKIEKDLMRVVPKKDWIWFSHALITHGRRVCRARNPNCPQCPVRELCANPVA